MEAEDNHHGQEHLLQAATVVLMTKTIYLCGWQEQPFGETGIVTRVREEQGKWVWESVNEDDHG